MGISVNSAMTMSFTVSPQKLTIKHPESADFRKELAIHLRMTL